MFRASAIRSSTPPLSMTLRPTRLSSFFLLFRIYLPSEETNDGFVMIGKRLDRCNEGSSKVNLRDVQPKKIPIRAIKKILSRRKICVTGSMIRYYNIQ